MTLTDWKNSFKDYALSSLRYQTMTERPEDIPEVHKSTFQWLYEPPSESQCRWDDLSAWLARGNGIYSAQGKVGSGGFHKLYTSYALHLVSPQGNLV